MTSPRLTRPSAMWYTHPPPYVFQSSGQPMVCTTSPGLCLLASTRHTSLTPIPYVCGSLCSLRRNRRMTSFDSDPCAPSASSVTRARNSMPGSKLSFMRPSRSSPTSFVRTPSTLRPSSP